VIHRHIPNIILALFLFSSLSQAQQIRFSSFGVNEGLSQSTVYTITQDSSGFIWIGTRDGLNMYDAAGVKIFRPDPENAYSLSHQTIRDILFGEDDALWIATDGGGLNYLSADRKEFKRLRTFDEDSIEIASDNLLSLEMVGNEIWAGSRYEGLIRYNVNTGFTDRFLEGLTIWDVALLHNGDVCAGTDQGFFCISTFDQVKKFLDDPVRAILVDEEGNVWVGAANGHLHEFFKGRMILDSRLPGAPIINAMHMGDNGHLWIGTASDGLFIYDPVSGDYQHFKADAEAEYSLSENAIRSLYLDQQKTMWVGTNTSGLNLFSTYRFKFDVVRSNERPDVVLSFTEYNGKLLAGKERDGICEFDYRKRELRKFDLSAYPALRQSSVIALHSDREGNLWLATDGQGLFKLDAEGRLVSRITEDKGLSNNSVLTLLEDSLGYIWAGTYNGLNMLRKNGEVVKRITISTEYPELLNERILSLFNYNPNSIWFGTEGNGVYAYDIEKDSIKRLLDRPDHVQSIIRCSQGKIWIGSYQGLGEYMPEQDSLRMITTRDGLPNNVVYGVVEADDSKLWVSTNGGISKYDMLSKTFSNYSTSDGLQSNEFNGGAYFKSKNGNIYFGGINGFNEIRPDDYRIDSSLAKTVVTDFILSGESQGRVESRENIMLRHTQNFFSFTFSSLDYVAPDKQQFRYKLIGLDEDWVDAGKSRRAVYTSIPPGEYTFVAQGTNADGIWGSESAPINLKIRKPYWATWWFISLFVLFASSLIYGIAWYRLKMIMKLQDTRNRIAGDLHDEVSATLSSISYFAQAIEQNGAKNQKKERYLELISNSAEEAREKISDIIWAIKPENDDWTQILAKCRRFASDVLESRNIQYFMDIDEDFDTVKPDLEVKQHFWLIFKEIITNIVRHSEATMVNISMKHVGHSLHVVVQDNGKGFRVAGQNQGNGLRNIMHRGKKQGLDVHFQTEEGFGTRWIIKIPL
jgi:ligand-binding sensor domain-containing protein/signal transduction histidine kinase